MQCCLVNTVKERKGGQCLCEVLVKTARDGEVWRDERGGRRKTEISAGVIHVGLQQHQSI